MASTDIEQTIHRLIGHLRESVQPLQRQCRPELLEGGSIVQPAYVAILALDQLGLDKVAQELFAICIGCEQAAIQFLRKRDLFFLRHAIITAGLCFHCLQDGVGKTVKPSCGTKFRQTTGIEDPCDHQIRTLCAKLQVRRMLCLGVQSVPQGAFDIDLSAELSIEFIRLDQIQAGDMLKPTPMLAAFDFGLVLYQRPFVGRFNPAFASSVPTFRAPSSDPPLLPVCFPSSVALSPYRHENGVYPGLCTK